MTTRLNVSVRQRTANIDGLELTIWVVRVGPLQSGILDARNVDRAIGIMAEALAPKVERRTR